MNDGNYNLTTAVVMTMTLVINAGGDAYSDNDSDDIKKEADKQRYIQTVK